MSKLLQRPGIKPSSVVSTVFLLAMVTIFLLAFPEHGYQTIATFKAKLFFRLAGSFVVMELLIWGELRLVQPHGAARERMTLSFDITDICAIAYLLFTIISASLSQYSGTLWGNSRNDGVMTIGFYVALFLILRRTDAPWHWVLSAFGGAIVIYCLIGLLQFTGQNPFGLYPQGVNYYDADVLYAGKYWSTIGNTNLCAALLSLAVGIFATVLIVHKSRRGLLSLFPLCLSIFSLVELQSEAGYVALFGGLLIGGPFLLVNNDSLVRLLRTYGTIALTASVALATRFYNGGVCFSPGKRSLLLAAFGASLVMIAFVIQKWGNFSRFSPPTLRKASFLILFFLMLLCVSALYLYGNWPEGFLAEGHELLHGRWEDSYGSGRLYIWRQTWDRIKESPLFGGGPDTLGQRGLDGFSRYNAVIGKVVKSQIDAAHNEYLNIWVNQGVFSLLAYLTLLVRSLLHWWRNPENLAAAIGGMGVLFYTIQAFFGISMPIITPYLWMALAILNKNERKREAP